MSFRNDRLLVFQKVQDAVTHDYVITGVRRLKVVDAEMKEGHILDVSGLGLGPSDLEHVPGNIDAP